MFGKPAASEILIVSKLTTRLRKNRRDMPMSDTLGSLPTGVTALVLDFAETFALMFLREVSLPLKRLAETWFFYVFFTKI